MLADNQQDPTEASRRQRIHQLTREQATEGGAQEALELRHGRVWTTDQLEAEFEAIGFRAPLVVVRHRITGQKGSLEFQGSPRYYFNWIPHTT